MATTEDIFSQAIALPQAERADLAHLLLQTLEPPGTDADRDRLWAEELNARHEALRRGDAKLIDWEEVSARIKRTLDSRRSS